MEAARTRALIGIAGVIASYLVAFAVIGIGLYVSGRAVADGGADTVDMLPAAIAALVLLTLKPHGHAFVAPGPRLIRTEHPRLFAILDEATQAVGVPAYDEVYVDGSGTVRVAVRDGVFGFGGDRTLTVGVPLVRSLSPAALSALAAHEAYRFGSTDHKLAAFVERTRERMRAGLDELAGGRGGIADLPFATSAGFFLRRTNEMSREWRLHTDEVVARVCGAPAMAEALRMSTGLPGAVAAFATKAAGPSPEFEQFAAFAAGEEGARAMSYARFQQAERANSDGGEPTLDARIARLESLEGAPLETQLTASRLVDQIDLLDWGETKDGFIALRTKGA